MKPIAFMIATLVLFCGGAKANAGSYTTYDLAWSGTPFSNPVSATGQVTLLTSAVFNGFADSLPSPDVAAFSITVTGDPNGLSNGTWGIGYFANMNLTVQSGEPLNPSAPLLGQPGLVDFNVSIGDASPFPPSASASAFTLSTFNGSFMILTEMTPLGIVPEPSSLALCVTASLCLAGYLGFRGRNKTLPACR